MKKKTLPFRGEKLLKESSDLVYPLFLQRLVIVLVVQNVCLAPGFLLLDMATNSFPIAHIN